MKIVYISHRIPFPPNKGDKIRSFNEIKYLSEGHEIHLACLADAERDLKYEEDLKKYCKSVCVVVNQPNSAKVKSVIYLPSKKPLSVRYFYSKRLQESIDQLLSTADIDVIFCFSSPMAEYVFRSKFLVAKKQRPASSSQRPKLIMDFVDVDSDKWNQYAQHAKWPLSGVYGMESRRLAEYERDVAETFDHSVFCTHAEERIFKTKSPHIGNVVVVQNGVDLDYFSPNYRPSPDSANQSPPNSLQQPIIVFTGVMDYFANVDGVVWFSNEVFPLVKKKVPEAKFCIVGSNPTREIRELAKGDGVIVTGYVPDTREYLKRAAVVVVPLRIARGIQNKILEAMAMGLAVVATPKAFEGMKEELRSDLMIEGSSKTFADSVVRLIRESHLRGKIGQNARKGMENYYNWSKNLRILDTIVYNLH
jgi:sugar transferase (PEP-CTERM/EpsH1 system associated)